METAKLMTKLSALLLLALVALQPATGMEKAETSNTRSASCLVKVTAHPAILPLNIETIDSLLRSSAVAGKAIRQVLNISPSELPYDAIETAELGTYDSTDMPGGMGLPPTATVPGVSKRSILTTPPQNMRDSSSSKAPFDEYEYEMMMQPGATGPAKTPTTPKPDAGHSTPSPTAPRVRPTTPSTPRATSIRSTRRLKKPVDAYGEYRSLDGFYGGGLAGGRDPFGNTYSIRPGRTWPSASAPAMAPSAADQLSERTFLFQLSVNLPDEPVGGKSVKPAAEEVVEALVENLRKALDEGYENNASELRNRLDFAESRLEDALSRLSAMSGQAAKVRVVSETRKDPADQALHEQLDQIVDLSELTQEMPFQEAIQVLRDSVDPPLKVVVIWRDIHENADIEPTTTIDMGGLPQVSLRAALELLLKSVSPSTGVGLRYAVRNGVITIGTGETVQPVLETRIYEIAGLAHTATAADLVRLLQETVEPETWFDQSEGGEGTIQLHAGNQLVIRQSRKVHDKIEKLLGEMQFRAPIGAWVDAAADIPAEFLASQRHELLRNLAAAEMELARLQSRRTAIEQQIAEMGKQAEELADDPVTAELEKMLELSTRGLAITEELVRDGHVSPAVLDKARMEIARARIELAKRRQELARDAGGSRLASLNNELTTLAIDLAEKTAEAQVLNRQLEQVNAQLSATAAFDPELARIRLAKRTFDIAERRANELRTLAAGLNPPTVAVLGANP
ncbi:MAG: hypothetical protein JSU94_03555 [Phycisphaerales bacterium]|nr:MAG: hypothetical protein JSU94_03555 [Phycisphaerales bacterium]